MSRSERLLLMAYFAVLLSVLGAWEPTATAVGGVAGAGAGVIAAGRIHRLRARIDARLGPDDTPVPTGLSVRRPAVRAGTHAVVLGAVLLTAGVLPVVGDELFAATAAASTAFPLVLTGSRLRG